MTISEWFLGSATLVLGLIAASAIVANIVIRNKDIDREHKRQTFEEILDWAKRGIELFSEYQRVGDNVGEREALRPRLRTLWAEKLGIVKATEVLGDKVLAMEVKEAVDNLDGYHFRFLVRQGRSTPNAEECERQFTSLFGIAYSRKAKLKL